ncbi:MAG: hypothetical protein ACI9J3_002575 [Parvicellaceae bacterium]|jgi:hypothetical protein
MKRILPILLVISILLCFGLFASIKSSPPSDQSTVDFLVEFLEAKYENESFDEFLYVGIKRQRLFHVKNGQVQNSWAVSTAARGAGNKFGSFKTPIGLHTIEAKIGQDAPIGAIFRDKMYTGNTAEISNAKKPSGKDAITTRILTLTGSEVGLNKGSKNVDTYKRQIYIHGTPEEGLIGKPVSHGCVRMRNNEIIDLFDQVFVGMNVIILNN